MKVAFVTGVTGQDGSYLCEFLLEKGYHVHGLIRRSSSFNTHRVQGIYHHPCYKMHYGDLTDSMNMCQLLSQIQPDEIYNLGAMSHVMVSFDMPEYTADVDGVGVLRLLNAMRACGLENKCRFYQASTSELYGKVQETPQKETTPFYPRSPYAVAKQFAFWSLVNYREAFGMHLSNGILFNHESPRRGPTFVTRKITRGVAAIHRGAQAFLELGNIDAKRDWGHAKDYVEGMWMMLQQEVADDYVLATGETHSVREFIEKAFAEINIVIKWKGETVDEVGYEKGNEARVLVKINPKYYRPTEVDLLMGDPTKAKNTFGWEAKIGFTELVQEMVREDIKLFDSGNFTHC